MMMVGSDGKSRAMTCLPLRKLAGWLMTIHANKVRPELRDVIQKYQSECDDALWDYWTKGAAINPNYRKAETRKALPNGLTIEQQEVVKAHHKALIAGVEADRQSSMSITLWSSVKSKFGVSYKQVHPDDFTEVISLMSRVATSGVYMPARKQSIEGRVLSSSQSENMDKLVSYIQDIKPLIKEFSQSLYVLESPLAPRVYSIWECLHCLSVPLLPRYFS